MLLLLVDTAIDSLRPRRMVDGALAGLRVTVEVDHELTEQMQRQTLTLEKYSTGCCISQRTQRMLPNQGLRESIVVFCD